MAGFIEIKLRWPKSVPVDQISVEFIQGMLDRMAMGFYSYGHVMRQACPPDAIACDRLRLKAYRKTHNTESLIDRANFNMMEFMRPKDPKAFFASTSRKETPGAILMDKRRVKGKEEF